MLMPTYGAFRSRACVSVAFVCIDAPSLYLLLRLHHNIYIYIYIYIYVVSFIALHGDPHYNIESDRLALSH